MINKTIILVLEDYKIKKILINIRILQELLLLLILYLFYTAELLEVYNNISKKLSISKFINNTSLLIYRLFTKYNYYILLKVYEKYLD